MKTLSVNYYFFILKILEGMGLERSDVDHIAPLELESNPHPSVRIEMEALRALFSYAETTLKDPHIGIHVSHNFRISNYGYAGDIYALCENIEHAMSLSRKYGCLAHTLGSFSRLLETNAASEMVTYIWAPCFDHTDDEFYKNITELVMCNHVLTINWLCWSFSAGVEKVTFCHTPSKPLTEYRKILNCEIEFGAPQNSITFNETCHTAPFATANPIKLSSLQNSLNQHLAAYNLNNDLTERVKYSLYEMIQHQRPNLALVAKDISLTERTLKRYLKNENTQFQNILRSVKMELCDAYIKEGLPLSEIAQRLWYFDQSALTRAYKKWHGTSPTRNSDARTYAGRK